MNTATAEFIAPPPPALRGLISGIFFAAIFLLAAPPAEAQTVHTYTFTATGSGGDRDPVAPGLQVDEGDSITFTLSFNSGGRLAEFGPIPLSGTVTADDYTCGTPTSCGLLLRQGDTSNRDSLQLIYSITDDATAEPDETFTLAVPQATPIIGSGTYTTTSTDITVTILANDGYVAPVDPVTPPVVTPGPGPGPATDNPTARAERLDAPAAAVARGIGGLAMDAVTKRARSVATTNQFHLGRANTAEELLRRSGFSLAGGDGGRGVSIWGSGGYISADGDHEGIDYDGDTSAFHIGGDTAWRDGLIGVAVSHSSGDIDFTVTADGMKSTLETSVTSVHPYLSRRINGSQLWLTAGYGSGDAELKEPDALIKTDITVTTAAFGINNRRGDLFTAGLSAQYNRAKLDAAESAGKTLPATTADTIRITANAETGWTHGAWRPFLNFALRHDSGDGNTGGAADLGGGVEWQTPTVLVRLAGSGHIQGQAADEQRATLTVRKSTGNFDLNLNLAADPTGVDTARLLHGEWRF
ncbi:MAG: autotransporter outer membrane beta-barrel domain-containing protein [Gammaproteobacteria bacterium]|nr:autotransporter outer membrane beta-barrel domain-containing protein [Gammaproteobacteria bacterium]